jgi:hypothetical protein
MDILDLPNMLNENIGIAWTNTVRTSFFNKYFEGKKLMGTYR